MTRTSGRSIDSASTSQIKWREKKYILVGWYVLEVIIVKHKIKKIQDLSKPYFIIEQINFKYQYKP